MLEIRGSGKGYAILNGQTVVGRATTYDSACGIANRIERMITVAHRRCLCCGRDFLSDGPGNRLCPACKEGPGE